VAAAAAGLAQTPAGQTMIRKAGLDPAPAGFTALAFTSPRSLPASLRSRKPAVPVSFLIRDVSGSPRQYQWQILLVRRRRSLRMASGTVAIPAGHTATIGRTVPASCVGRQVELEVRLVAPAEAIDFRAACPWRQGPAT